MAITLAPWEVGDLDVLRRANTPELTEYLGGPEPEEALAERHAEYLAPGGGVHMFRIEVDGAVAGYAGWWEQEHEGAPAYEVGCVVEPAQQGRGIASAVLGELVRRATATGGGRPIVGYAHVGNEASRALCRSAGFALEGTGQFPAADGGEPTTVDVWVIRP